MHIQSREYFTLKKLKEMIKQAEAGDLVLSQDDLVGVLKNLQGLMEMPVTPDNLSIRVKGMHVEAMPRHEDGIIREFEFVVKDSEGNVYDNIQTLEFKFDVVSAEALKVKTVCTLPAFYPEDGCTRLIGK